MDQLAQALAPVIQGLAGKFGIVTQIIMVIGAFRIVFKPLMTLIEAVVKATPTQADDQVLNTVEASLPFKALQFLVDYVASIKLPAPAPAAKQDIKT